MYCIYISYYKQNTSFNLIVPNIEMKILPANGSAHFFIFIWETATDAV